MSPEMHERVMNRASRLWQECGRPDGRYREFWEEARREIMLTDGQSEPDRMDELAAWAPARPLPRCMSSTWRRPRTSVTRGLRRLLERL